MAKAVQDSIDWQSNPMDSPLMLHFCKYAICRDVSTADRFNKLVDFADDIGDFDELKEALSYLEYSNWNAGEARLVRELDRLDRAGPVRDAKGNEISNHDANLTVNRSLAEKGDKYDGDLLNIKVNVNGRERNFTYPKARTIEGNSQSNINDLNRWRHSIFRQYIGRQRFEKKTSRNYHRMEVDYILNRYADQDVDYRGRCKYDEVAEDLNAIFEGMFLPGRYKPCEKRTKDSITSIITRKAVNPTDTTRSWPKSWGPVKRHDAAQDRIIDEWEERKAENEDNAEDEEDEVEVEDDETTNDDGDGEPGDDDDDDDGDCDDVMADDSDDVIIKQEPALAREESGSRNYLTRRSARPQ